MISTAWFLVMDSAVDVIDDVHSTDTWHVVLGRTYLCSYHKSALTPVRHSQVTQVTQTQTQRMNCMEILLLLGAVAMATASQYKAAGKHDHKFHYGGMYRGTYSNSCTLYLRAVYT